MSAIDKDLAEGLFQGVQFARDALPVVETLVEILFPALIPEIEIIKQGQTKLFELVALLESAHVGDLDETKEQLRQQTLAAWRASRV